MVLQILLDKERAVHAYLLVATGREALQAEVERFLSENDPQLRAFAHVLKPEEGSIDIEATRSFRKLFNLQGVAQVTLGIIEEIDKMTLPAQQMLLKLLEEAPKGVIFVLTTTKPKTISLPLRSRVQLLRLQEKVVPDAELQGQLAALFADSTLLFEKQQHLDKLTKNVAVDDLLYAISWYLWNNKANLNTLQKWFVTLSYVRHSSTLKNSLEYFFLT